MKKIILVVLAVMVFCLAGCQNGTTGGVSPFEGTWRHWRAPTSDFSKYTFSGNKFEWIWQYNGKVIGTFEYDATTIYFTYTRMWEDINTGEFKEGRLTIDKKYFFEKNGNLVFPSSNDHGEQYVKIN